MKTREDKIYSFFGHLIMTILTLLAIIPILLMFISSLTDNATLLQNGYSFLPEKWSTYAYEWVFTSSSSMVIKAYGMSFILTATGVVCSLALTTCLAYGLSKKGLPGRNVLTFLVFFTMLFNGGIVSSYIMWTQIFHIKNTYFALLLPNLLMNAMNIMLVRNYYKNSIPFELVEAAEIDGASELKTFWKIMVPLSVPVNVTVGLFTGLAYWNDWINALYYVDDPVYYGIQNFLVRMMNNIQFLSSGNAAAMVGSGMASLPSTGIRMALAVVGVLPIVVIYPFLQKYLTKGVIMGAVKG